MHSFIALEWFSIYFTVWDLQALGLDPKIVKKRQVEFIDIAMDPVENYVESEDPMMFKSQKTGRGPLKEGWQVGSSSTDNYIIQDITQREDIT